MRRSKTLEQPLRGFLVDDKFLCLKEEFDPRLYKAGELPNHIRVVIYDIYDPLWVRWAKDLFFFLFRTSISAQKRLEELQQINKLAKKQSV